MADYTTKVAELQADISAIWQLQCKNLYNSKNLGALAVREALQNSIDAIGTAIKAGKITAMEALINIDFDEESTLTITDNGIGMDIATIHNKFLSLGGTTKGTDDNVGGFGLAKAVILGCGDWFAIQTQDNYMNSDFLGKEPIKKTDWFDGTIITIKNVQMSKTSLIGSDLKQFKRDVMEYIATSQLPYPVAVNGELVSRRFESTAKSRRSLKVFGITEDMVPDKTKLRVNCYKGDKDSSGAKYMYIRLRGLTQYRSYLGWNANCDITVDFDTKLDPRSDEYPFSTNREGLKYKYQEITSKIQDKVTQSPLSVSNNDYYKETLYDNTRLGIEGQRRITQMMTTEEMAELVEQLSKVSTDSKLITTIKTMQDDVKVAASEAGVETTDYIKKASDLQNPLEYSWLIWEDGKWKGKKLNRVAAVDIILVWDSVLQQMTQQYRDCYGKVFYPGIIVQKDTNGMCVEKTLPSGEQRVYVMLNPFSVPAGLKDLELTMWMMNLAAHELAHFVCGCYEAHGETWAYTREGIFNKALGEIQTINQTIKAGKFKQRLRRVSSRTSTINKKQEEPFPIDFTGKSIEEIEHIADEYGVDTWFHRMQYPNEPIRKMRLIMAIKKAYKKQNA